MSANAATVAARDDPPFRLRRDLACLNHDPEVFFAAGPGVEVAKQVCRTCPAVDECREWAIETRQNVGVWGATTERDRRKILRRRHPC